MQTSLCIETNVDALACFVPTFVKRRLNSDVALPQSSIAQSIHAAVMFADISGFSKLASSLAEDGREGAEELNRILNAYYGPLVDIIQAHGGDVINFAGDAILTIWESLEGELAVAVLRAAQAGVEVQQKLNNFEVVPGVRLSLRMTIGAGEVTAAPISGVQDYRQLSIVGEPLDQLWKGDKLTRVGDVVLSSQAAQLVKQDIDGERLSDNCCRIRAINKPIDPLPLPAVQLDADARDRLRPYVPRTVLARIDAGQAGYLADLRRVTVMFVNFVGVPISQLQTLMEILQATMSRYEGTVVQLMTDDKGTVGIAGFGLPPFTHEDDAVRAILAAEAIQTELRIRGWQGSVGIATGRVFCGPLGNEARRIYTMIGNKVNLAARLMQHAHGEVLCDEETERATRGRSRFQVLPRFVIKGMPDPVPVFRPISATSVQIAVSVIGREDERLVIQRALDEAKAGGSSALSIEGEAGIGKSTLVTHLLEQSYGCGLRPLVGACSSIEKQTPYFAWRAIFSQLLGLESLPSLATRRARVLEQLPTDSDSIRLAPLLNPLLGVDFPSNEIVDQLDGRTRAENLHALLILLLEQAAARQPLVIVLDDVQWLDSASWRLVQLSRERVRPLCLALAMRPLPAPQPEEYLQLIGDAQISRLKLDFLKRADCLELARRTLGISKLSAPFADYLVERSLGNPFFVRELASYLRDTGRIVVTAGCCDLHQATDGDGFADIPTAISDLITSRIDQLSLSEQMTLKTASVIGRSFPHPTLKDVYPVTEDRERLLDFLQMLERQELTGLETSDPVLRYLFKHVTIQQTAYDQLPLANRRQLHREVARWYESRHRDDPSYFPLLAYHWGKTDSTDNHIDYLAKSGDEALRGGANKEAEKFFHQALDRHQEKFGESPPAEERLRRARWERRRGDALYHLGQFPQSRSCLRQALALLDRPASTGVWSTHVSTLKQVLIQLARRLRRGTKLPSAPSDALAKQAENLHEASLANQRLARICYFENQLPTGINHILRAVNEGEAVGATPELSRAYGKMCVCMSLLPCRFMAEHYAHLAISTARATKDLASIADAQSTICMYRIGAGEWDLVAAGAEETVSISRQLVDLERLAYGTTTQALQACFQSKFETSLQHFARLAEIAAQSGNVVYQAWGLCGQAECRLRLGQPEAAISLLDETCRLLHGKDDRTEEVRAHGLLAAACWRFGQEATALQHAADTMDLLEHCTSPTCTILEGFAGPAEVYLNHWEGNRDSESARASALKAVGYVTWYARVFPIGRPRARRLQGLIYWLSNRAKKARTCWQDSLATAETLGMPLEAGLAHFELGRHAETGSVERDAHLQNALRTFGAIGATHEMRLVSAASSSDI